MILLEAGSARLGRGSRSPAAGGLRRRPLALRRRRRRRHSETSAGIARNVGRETVARTFAEKETTPGRAESRRRPTETRWSPARRVANKKNKPTNQQPTTTTPMKLETQSCLTALRRFPWPSANETTAAKGEFSANHWPGSSPDPLTSGSIHLFRETRVAPGHSRWPPRCSRELNFREEKNRLIDDLCDLCAVFLATPVPHASRARRDAPIYKRAWEKDASRSDFLVAYLCRRDGHPSLLSGSSILPLKGRQHMERADVRDARPFGLGRRLCAAVVDRPTAPQPRPLRLDSWAVAKSPSPATAAAQFPTTQQPHHAHSLRRGPFVIYRPFTG